MSFYLFEAIQMLKRPYSYTEALRSYADQWTEAQIKEAIEDEKRLLRDNSLSDLAVENSQQIVEIYHQVLEEKFNAA
jgi:tagatose-1,6-bisphosphate aldolase non-catalytic subunit AgaZ/GatZ